MALHSEQKPLFGFLFNTWFMIKAVIIDDEKDARYLLHKMLIKKFGEEITVTAEADSCATGVEVIQEHRPDIVFLDIQLTDGTAFDLLNSLDSHSFNLVFVTAYDRFAIKAFEFSAVGYLVKPLNPAELDKAFERIKKLRAESKKAFAGIKVLIENYNAGKIKKIVVPNADGFNIVQLENILYVKSIRNYSEFFLTDKTKIVTSKTLVIYEKLLVDHGFFRIHQTYLINLTHIKSYVRSDGGGVKMISGEILPVARQKKAELLEKFYK